MHRVKNIAMKTLERKRIHVQWGARRALKENFFLFNVYPLPGAASGRNLVDRSASGGLIFQEKPLSLKSFLGNVCDAVQNREFVDQILISLVITGKSFCDNVAPSTFPTPLAQIQNGRGRGGVW